MNVTKNIHKSYADIKYADMVSQILIRAMTRKCGNVFNVVYILKMI